MSISRAKVLIKGNIMEYGTMFIRCVFCQYLGRALCPISWGSHRCICSWEKLVTLYSTAIKMEGTNPLE